MQGARLRRFPFSGGGRSARPETPAPVEAPVTERLPLFAELIERAASGGRCVVLDFAPPSQAGIALFNDMHCRVDIVNFPQALASFKQASTAEDLVRRIRAAIPHDPAHRPNVVLCWDFLNYLPRNVISVVMEQVACLCAPHAQMHALMAYSSPEMPAQPCRYTPSGRDAVEIRPRVERMRESPRMAPKELERCLPGYSIDRVMMLRSGFQEYILRLKGAHSDAPPEVPEGVLTVG